MADPRLSPRYHVSSVMLKGDTDDTLEVCLREDDDVDEEDNDDE